MSDLAKWLRNRTIMVNYGHGDVRDVADEDCVAAADRIDALEAENKALRERNAELCDALPDVLSLAESYLNVMPDRHGIHIPKLDRARALLAKGEK